MTTKTAITFAFFFSFSAIAKSQSTAGLFESKQTFADQNTMYASVKESSNDQNNPTYRKVGNTRYLVLKSEGETHLYQLESQYFFSRGTGQIQKLTLKNLKNAFAGDLQFNEALDGEFKSDEELTSNESLPRLAALFEIQEDNALMVSRNVEQK